MGSSEKWNAVVENFDELKGKVYERVKNIAPLTGIEKERLKLELDVIKQTHTAGIFLQFVDTMYALKDTGAIFYGLMYCSYVCYVLGLTRVNPLDYGLLFERFYHKGRKTFPTLQIAVLRDKKDLAEDILSKFGIKFEYVIQETKIGKYRQFTEEEIYQKALEYFSRRNISLGRRYQGEQQAEKIFSETDGRYILPRAIF